MVIWTLAIWNLGISSTLMETIRGVGSSNRRVHHQDAGGEESGEAWRILVGVILRN
jgi:hypothetical protein